MLFHVSPSHYSLEWPCQILWVRQPKSLPPSTHPCSPSRASGPLGPGCPEHACKAVPLAPSPGATAGELAGLSAVPKPGSSLSYKTERTWKLKQEKPRAGARGLLGQLWKDKPARATTLFIGSLGETYMVRKRNSSHHKTQPCCFVACRNATKLTQRQLRGVGSSEQSHVSIAVIPAPCPPPSTSQDAGFRETAFHFPPGRGAPH